MSKNQWRWMHTCSAIALAAAVPMAFAPAAHATIPSCNLSTLQAAAPPGLTIGDIPDLNPGFPKTTNGVADVPANVLGAGSPEVCLITGAIVTNPATGKTANFGALLPDPSAWNYKFMFNGCAFNCGIVYGFKALPVDPIQKGYPVWFTDEGHVGFLQNNPSWPITAPGQPNEDAIIDFAYRATHTVTVVGKQFTLNYYNAAKFAYSYFEGCSDGGRDAMVEASRYPEDYDGVMAGAPYFDPPGQALASVADITAQLRSPDALLSPALFALASQIANQQCDALDGVQDGLIQNPAICRFNPQTDLPRCPGDTPDTGCFTQAQIDSLSNVFSAATDPHGLPLHPGYSVSDMNELAIWLSTTTPPSNFSGPQPWPNYVGAPEGWDYGDPTLQYLTYYGVPGYNSLTTPGFSYRADGPGPIQFFHTVVPENTVDTLFDRLNIAAGDFPQQLRAFIAQNRKLIMYHGYADGLITPYTTIQYYRKLARTQGGFDALQHHVRLFMVPEMYHCHGGPGPNNFGTFAVQPAQTDALHDATTALEQWAENGIAPDQFIATKFTNDDPTQPALRTMPVCPFPAQAQYTGSGDVKDAANWTCAKRDRSLLRVGLDGYEAGVQAPLFTGWPVTGSPGQDDH